MENENKIKKAIVIGCPGSGKTTFAARLAAASGLPLVHLDAIWHRADRTHITREEFDARLGELLAQDAWLIDGHYSRTLERRVAACDTVFLFDLPPELCLAGAEERLGQARVDMPWIDTVLDLRLAEEIRSFRERALPEAYALLERHGREKRVEVFYSRAQADAFLVRLAGGEA